MKLTIGLKLNPTQEQAAALLATLERANEAADEVSRVGWEAKVFGQFALHKLTYSGIRESFGVSAQLAVRVIAKVADAYKLDKKRQRKFHRHGSVAYDDRILKYGKDTVSIWTLDGRERIPFACGEPQRKLLELRQGESDLVYRKGKWYLFATVNVIEPPTDEPEGFLGVDLGIARIATDSSGESFTGAHLRNLRKRNNRLRKKLQAKGTKSTKRLLKARSGKEARFAKDLNHCISKRLVQKAKRTKQAIVLEDLKHIRKRIRANKAHRTELNSWSFGQLREFVKYKAKREGVQVIVTDARNSSRECSQCQHVSRSNRRSQKVFQCQQCGHSRNADVNAALNLSSRAARQSAERGRLCA